RGGAARSRPRGECRAGGRAPRRPGPRSEERRRDRAGAAPHPGGAGHEGRARRAGGRPASGITRRDEGVLPTAREASGGRGSSPPSLRDKDARRGKLMKAVVIRRFGGPEVLEYLDWPEPTVGPSDVLIRVHAVTVGRTLDVEVRERGADF